MLKIDSGATSWPELQAKGLAVEKAQGGRPTELTGLDRLIAQKKSETAISSMETTLEARKKRKNT